MSLPRLTYLSALSGFLIFLILGCQTESRVALIEDGGDRGAVGVLDRGDVLGDYTDAELHRRYGPVTSNRVKTPVEYKYGALVDARPAGTYTAARNSRGESRSAATASAGSSAQTDARRGAEGVLGSHKSESLRADSRSSNLNSRGGESGAEWRISGAKTGHRRGEWGVHSDQRTQNVASGADSTESRPSVGAKSSGSALHSFIIQPLSGSARSQERTGRAGIRQRAKNDALRSDSRAAHIASRNISRRLVDRSGMRDTDLILSSTTLLSRRRTGGVEPISVERQLASVFEDFALQEEQDSAHVASSSVALGAKKGFRRSDIGSYSSRTSLDATSGENAALVVKRERGHGSEIASRTIDMSSGLSVSAELHRRRRLERSYLVAGTSQRSAEGGLENLSERSGTGAMHLAERHGTSSRAAAANVVSRAAKPDIKLKKSVDKKSAAPGEVLTFTISYENAGDGPASNLTISDSLPRGLKYVSGSASGKDAKVSVHRTWGGATRITWRITKVITPGESGFVRFKARVR